MAADVLISMLRGVNVGRHNRIKMDALRAVYEKLGAQQPQTVLQSGNVVFRTGQRNLAQLAPRIEDALEQAFGFRPAVILRTARGMADVIARNPFAGRDGIDPAKLLVTFLPAELNAATRTKLLAVQSGPEELHVSSRELYIYFPNGMGRSKLVLPLDKILAAQGTARNWNTVTKLFEAAQSLHQKL